MTLTREDAQVGRQYEYELEQEDMKSLQEDETAREVEEQIAAIKKRCKTCLFADTDGDEPVCLALGTTLQHMTLEECENCYERSSLYDEEADADEGAHLDSEERE